MSKQQDDPNQNEAFEPTRLEDMSEMEALDRLTDHPLALGAAGLRRSYKRFFMTALAIAIFLHVAGFGSFQLVKLFGAQEEAPEAMQMVNYADLAPPPSVADAPTPPNVPPPPIAPAPIAAGIPEAVPDEEAPPEQTIATQEELASNVGEGVGEGVGVIEGTGPPAAVAPPPPPPAPPPPPPPPPADGPPPDFVAVEEQAVPVNNPDPEYPDFARRAGIEGRVIVKAWVTAEGTVREVQLLRGTHELLDEAAVAAVRRWTFTPAKQNGRPVAIWVSIPVNFRLN